MTRVVIRADASPEIGSGHVMRCVALAQALRARGAAVEFIGLGVPPRVSRELASWGIHAIVPPVTWPDPGDAEAVIAVARKGAADARWVIVDGYRFDAEYQRRLSHAGVSVAWLDDSHLLDRFETEFVVNPTLGAERCAYAAATSTRLLAGATYALLRRSIREGQRGAATPPQVVIALGGADPPQLTPRVVQAVRRAGLDGVHIVAVVGPSNPHIEAVRAAAAGAANVSVLQDPPHLRNLLAHAALVIAAAGTMTWELAFLGVPMLLLVIADNQERGAAMMREAAAADVIRVPVDLAELPGRLSALWADPARRQAMAARAQRLVDGRGADRVARWITEGAAVDAVVMRPAEGRDALQVWRINSEPTVRANSFDPAPIPLARHFTWFDGHLADESSRQYVFERDDELAAVVRYARGPNGDHAELGFAVASSCRGRGLGARVLAESCRPACNALGVRIARGLVIDGNAPSVAAFHRAGFAERGHETRNGRDCVVFERRVP